MLQTIGTEGENGRDADGNPRNRVRFFAVSEIITNFAHVHSAVWQTIREMMLRPTGV